MDKIKIGDKEFGFKLTLESWKKLKSSNNITPYNIKEKMEEDLVGVLSAIVFYGLSPKDREVMPQDEIDLAMDIRDIQNISERIKQSVSVPETDDDPKN